jgi:hypothetical protein
LAELAEVEVGAEVHFQSLCGVEAVKGGKGDEYLVADAVDIHDEAVRVGLDDLAAESGDHDV